MKNLNARESQKTSTGNMSLQFTRRKPIKEQKLLDTILIALAKVVDGRMSGGKSLNL